MQSMVEGPCAMLRIMSIGFTDPPDRLQTAMVGAVGIEPTTPPV